MKRHVSRSSAYHHMDSSTDEITHAYVTSRAFSSAITQAPVIEEAGNVSVWDEVPRHNSLGTSVSEPMWYFDTTDAVSRRTHRRHAIREGSTIADMIQASPEEVITVLRDHAVRKLGTFQVKDRDVLAAFGDSPMLTRGDETARDGNYQRNWLEVIRGKVERHRRMHVFEGAWEENVTVAAYVVNLKNAAAGRQHGLLSPLVKKSQSGATGNEIWDFPAVRAVIEYKWHYWARFYLVAEFVLYLGWLISFSLFLITYIEWDLTPDLADMSARGRFFKLEASFFDICAVLFMLPFLVVEYNTIKFYKLRWFQFWNVLDTIAYILQVAVTYGHLTEQYVMSKAYNTILAVQCVILFIKVQYFARVFGAGVSFVELLTQVMYRVRWFFAFILLTMISVALAFAALYMQDVRHIEEEKKRLEALGEDVGDLEDDSDLDFGNVVRSLVTTYAVLLGDFDSDYVFESSNNVIKGLFFLGFQVLMSITVLNLLIAVMTESYTTTMLDARMMHNMNKAQLMDELEVALPMRWGPRLKPYCHFLVVEKKAKLGSMLSEELTHMPTDSKDLSETLQNDITQLKSSVENLTTMVATLNKRLNISDVRV